MPRGKRAGSKMPTADYDAGCRVRSTSTKCPTRKSRTSSSPPISRPENAWASRPLFRQSSKSLAKTCKSGSRKALLHLAPESRVAFFPKTLYKARARIEQAVGKLKRFKRIAPRCEKTAQNYGSFVALALGFILIKSVHTA